MRLFIGIPLPAVTIEELTSLSLRLRSAADGMRWSAPESWHITVQFLGNTGPEQYECAVRKLRELRMEPFPILFEGAGIFERVGILYVGVALTEELRALERRVTALTGACGFTPETRPYHPHVTLARAKGKQGRQTLKRNQRRCIPEPQAPLAGFPLRKPARNGFRTGHSNAGFAIESLKAHARRPPRFTPFLADVVLLYESIPSATGSRYEVRERFPLAAGRERS